MLKTFLYLFAILNIVACKNERPSKSVTEHAQNIIDAAPDTAILNYLMGHFIPDSNENFVLIQPKHANRSGMYLRTEAYEAFNKMYDAALKDGIKLEIISATRNFDYQKGIWERKWSGQTILSSGENASLDFNNDSLRARKILEYSSMPGTSRHHWGTDFDLNNLENAWFEKGEGLKLFNWLEKNASLYGFCRPYTRKGDARPEGYNEEKWHWSYTPLSDSLTEYASRYLTNEMISGFLGSQTSEQINVVHNYILGIDHSCNH
ncbi:MAG: M15 family metallopeptidase [Saprospiraceae bacterium]|nr:M15 family metallopeptidase [Saprospiraceae bacterium]